MRESVGTSFLLTRLIGIGEHSLVYNFLGGFSLSLLAMSNNTTPFGFAIATARKVTPLRQRMIDDMTVRNFAPNTMLCYLKQVSYFAQYFGRSPDRSGPEEIRSYQIYLAKERKVGISSRTVAVSALDFGILGLNFPAVSCSGAGHNCEACHWKVSQNWGSVHTEVAQFGGLIWPTL